MSDFVKYRRSKVSEARKVTQEDIDRFKATGSIEYSWTGKISISDYDIENGSPKIGDMIGRNSLNHKDQWLIAEKFFNDNYELFE